MRAPVAARPPASAAQVSRPYQPSLLRALHIAISVLAVGSAVTALFVYSRHDGRWGHLPLVPPGDWIDVHGSLGVMLELTAVPFVLYALGPGRARLARPANAAVLAALLLVLGSGLGMDEEAMRQGAHGAPAYAWHLGAALLLGLAVFAHAGAVLLRGGWPLARSMYSRHLRQGDRPADWPQQLRRFFGAG